MTSTPSPAVLEREAIDPRLFASLAAVYLIWSSTYLALRIAVETLPPLLSSGLRFTVAGLVLFAIALRRGARIPPVRDWLRIAPAGVLLFLGGNGFIAIASQSLTSSGIAVVCAMMPLWMGVLAMITGERPTAREWLSLVIGFIGVVVLIGSPSLAGDPIHIVLTIASPIAWAAGSLIARRTKHVGGVQANVLGPAIQMLTGGAALILLALVRGETLVVEAVSTRSWIALGYLVVFGSLLGFTAYAWLLRNARSAVATSYGYVNPILAVLLGAAVYGEPLGWTTAIANVLIVGAVMLVLLRPRHA